MRTKEDIFWGKQKKKGVALNEVQRQAVVNTGGALLLLASPGAGKTTTIIMKIGYLLEVKGIQPARIKAVTFSRAAAEEMKTRFKRFFPTLALVDFSTIHSLAFEVAREHFRKNRLNYQLIEGSQNQDKRHILREIFKNVTQENITEDQMDELTTYISFIKNKLILQEKWSEIDCNVPAAAEIMRKYEEFKSASDKLLLDYDDMLIYANKAFDQDRELLGRYQQLYDYILTDESQDTSLVQHYIIEKLVRKHGKLCVVADDDQSIYSWRGAEPSYLLNFKNVYPSATILFMEQNYRSSKEIVDTANVFIKRNKQRYNKNMFTHNPAAHKPIIIHSLTDYKNQAKYLIEEIKKLDHSCKIAVLYRNNSSSIILINELDRAGISCYIKDEDKRFFSHWVVEDILNFMRLTYTDKRIDIFEKIFTKVSGYITKQQMEAIKKINNNESVFDNLLKYAPLQEYQLKQIEECKETIRLMKGMAPLAVICTIRRKLGYEKALERMCERLGFRKDYLLGILNTLEEIAAGLSSMEDFASRLKYLETVMKSSKNNKDSWVTLSTFHSAKGLEFDRVYMIDLLEGIIPTRSDIEQKKEGKPEAMEEAVRLFYVGMTRAKTHLELLTYDKRDHEKVSESEFVASVRNIISPPVVIPKINVKQRAKVSPMVSYNSNAIKNANQLKIGSLINHQSFGRGKIVSITSSNIDIKFNGTIKTLSIEICLTKGFLEPA
ncbi:ATP-dependent helicase [Pelosinus sp. sgz500959]|uniref:ATP-dependent helicase n=1 Tax=Pelosinus sp. sgz500959 TaxID=3242472 RepID=UPI003671BB84